MRLNLLKNATSIPPGEDSLPDTTIPPPFVQKASGLDFNFLPATKKSVQDIEYQKAVDKFLIRTTDKAEDFSKRPKRTFTDFPVYDPNQGTT